MVRFITNRNTTAPKVLTLLMIWLEAKMELKNKASKALSKKANSSMAYGQKSRISATRLYKGATGLR